jgi:hypothetical protein
MYFKDTLNTDVTQLEDKLKRRENIVVEEYTADFYLKQLPTSQAAIDSIGKERNKAYYQLGDLQGKFKEYELATTLTVVEK